MSLSDALLFVRLADRGGSSRPPAPASFVLTLPDLGCLRLPKHMKLFGGMEVNGTFRYPVRARNGFQKRKFRTQVFHRGGS